MIQGTKSPCSTDPKAQSAPQAVLIIGAHREELPFGERVAEGLDSRMAVLRIPEGISGHRPRPDEVFYYETRHRELYLQLRQQIRGRYQLVIDLHRGLNEPGRCADVLCRDAALLRSVHRATLRRYGPEVASSLVRTVRMTSNTNSGEPTIEVDASDYAQGPFGKTVIPAGVWDSEEFLYVGVEIYLTCEGQGQADDWAFARWLIRTVVAYESG
jgi:hypothetical protein